MEKGEKIKSIQIRMDDEEYKILERLAEYYDVTRAELCRRLIDCENYRVFGRLDDANA